MGKYVDGVYYDYTEEEKKKQKKEQIRQNAQEKHKVATNEDFLKMLAEQNIQKMKIPKDKARKFSRFYPTWESLCEEKAVSFAGQRFTYEDDVFEVLPPAGQQFLKSWVPGPETASIFELIPEQYDGTMEDPIVWKNNGKIEKNKFYTDPDYKKMWKGVRDTGIAVFDDLEKLSRPDYGGFVELVEF